MGPAATMAMRHPTGLWLKERGMSSGVYLFARLLAHHAHESAQGNGGDPVFGLAPRKSPKAGPEAQAEGGDSHPGPLGHEEMAQLMDEYQNAQDDDGTYDCGHAAPLYLVTGLTPRVFCGK